MSYTLQFGQVTGYLPYLAGGAWISLQIAFLAFCGGMVIGLFGAMTKTFGGRVLNHLVGGYVTFFMNTPQLVQIYFLYFALPEAGILLTSYEAVLIGMTLNAGAYLTEIQRAGFESVHRNEMEAAETLGMTLMQRVRYVVLPHIARVLFPPLSNQYILMTLGTYSIVPAIYLWREVSRKLSLALFAFFALVGWASAWFFQLGAF